MRVFVTGVNGQLGHDVVNELARVGIEAIGSDRRECYSGIADGSAVTRLPYVSLDITDEAAVMKTITELEPDAVIHCAAWTNVDGAEDPVVRDIVFAVNAKGPRWIAQAARAVDAKMVYISTDYVFSGDGTEPWLEESKDFAPQNVYGASKLEGEQAVAEVLEKFFIVRTAWVFGRNGNNFVKTMLKLGKTHKELRVVCDQVGTPTYTPDLARLLVAMVQSEKYGFYHATNSGGYISWYDFAVEIFRQAQMDVTVHPVSTAQYGVSIAKRPENSRLSRKKLTENGFDELPPWQQALSSCLTTQC